MNFSSSRAVFSICLRRSAMFLASSASGLKRMEVMLTARPRCAMRFFKPSRYSGVAADEAKAVDVVAETDIRIARTFVVAIPGAAILGAESPGAAAQHFVLTFIRPSWILAGRFLVIVHLVEIVAPFPHVAGHVVESPRIG